MQPNAKLKNLFGKQKVGVEVEEEMEDYEAGSKLELSESELEGHQSNTRDDRPFANVFSMQTNLDYVSRIRHQQEKQGLVPPTSNSQLSHYNKGKTP